jgi:hypothetical protein
MHSHAYFLTVRSTLSALVCSLFHSSGRKSDRRFGCAVGVVASSTKAAPIIRLWAASDVVALDLPLVGAWWCCYRPAGLLPPVPGGFSADDREDLPGTRQVLELVAAAAFQPDGGVGDQVLDGAGDLMRCP